LIKVKVFYIAELRNGRWQVKRVSVTNVCFATNGKNESWWTCYLMTHEIMIDKREWERERMFTRKLNLMSSMNVKISIDWFFEN
jgi:hypothetical protein